MKPCLSISPAPRRSLALAIVLFAGATYSVAADEKLSLDRGVAELAANLSSPLTAVRIAAAEGLGKAGLPSAAAVPALIRALNDNDVVVRSHSAWALGKIGQPSDTIVPALIAKIQAANEEWPVRHNAGLSLSWIGKPAVSALQKTLSHEDSWARAYAAEALLRVGPISSFAKELMPVITRLLTDKTPQVRRYSLPLLSQLGDVAVQALPDVTKLLEDPDSTVRSNAAQALSTFGGKAKSAVPSLLKALKQDEEQWVRIGAANALGQIGDSSPETVSALIDAFRDKKERVGAYAVEAVAKFGEAAVPALQLALKSDDAPTRMSAADALAYIGPKANTKAKPASEALAPLVESDKDWMVRARAANALGLLNVSSEKVLNALKAGTKDEHEIVRLNAENALKALGKVASAG